MQMEMELDEVDQPELIAAILGVPLESVLISAESPTAVGQE